MNKMSKAIALITFVMIFPGMLFADELQKIIERYESGLMTLVGDGTEEEQAVAIQTLALLSSPRFEDARNILLKSNSKVVQAGLLKAIGKMGDESAEAHAFVVQTLNADSSNLIGLALSETRFEISFGDIWKKDHANLLWREYLKLSPYELPPNRLTNINSAQPWKDPAWNELSRDEQIYLLARSASKESIQILETLGEIPPYVAEPEKIDPEVMRQLLDTKNKILRSYAARALLKVKDQEYVDRIVEKIKQFDKSQIPNNPNDPIEVDGVAIYFVLPVLETETLRDLLNTSLTTNDSQISQLFSYISQELSNRGQPLTQDEISKIQLPSSSERTLDYQRVNAVVREYSFSELPKLIQDLTSTKSDILQNLIVELGRSPKFLSDLPNDVAHNCFAILRESENTNQIRQLKGLLARGDDQEELWEEWKSSKDPFSQESLEPILWGFNPRSAYVRKRLGNADSQINNFLSLGSFSLQRNKIENCKNLYDWSRRFPMLWFQYPLLQGRHWELFREFSEELAEKYDDNDNDAFILDFLEIRGVQLDSNKIKSSLQLLKDKRYSIRYFVWEFLASKLPILNGGDSFVYDEQTVRDFLQLYEAQNSNVKNEKWSLAGPQPTERDYSTVEEVIERDKDQFLINIKDQIARSDSSSSNQAILNGLPPFQPSDIFINDASYYQKQLKELTSSDDQNLRYAALWALWRTSKDQDVLQIWLKDAKSDNYHLRIMALSLLQQIRYEPAKDLYPPLLSNSNHELQVLGILGIRAFHLQQFWSQVAQLINSTDMIVACAATATLADLEPKKSRPILINLLSNETILADAALLALRKFDSSFDIDYYSGLLDSSKLDPIQRERLFTLVMDITYQKQIYYQINDPNESQLKSLIQIWNNWWKENRGRNKEQWFRSTVDLYVKEIAKDPDSRLARIAMSYINGVMPNQAFVNPENTEEEATKFQTWWHSRSKDSLWDILIKDYYPQIWADDSFKLKVLDDLFPHQTAGLIFGNAIKCGSSNFAFTDIQKASLINPCLTSCEARPGVLKQWNEWAIHHSERRK